MGCMLLVLTGCGGFRNAESDGQTIVTRKLVGMKVGDFITRYGPPFARDERPDGTLDLRWKSALASVPPGFLSPDEQFCQLNISSDKARFITTAMIFNDTKGNSGTSRCAEMFR